MNKKLLLSLLLGSVAIGASAETVAWVNIGSTGLRNNIYVRGEYSELRYMTIEFHTDSVDNYMVDPATDFEAKLNDEPVTVIPLDKSEFGYKRCMFLLDNYVQGENKMSIKTRIRYINLNFPDEIRYTSKSVSTTNYIMNVNKYTTPESADAFKESFIPNHEELIEYPLGNPPGEYDYLHGDYAIHFQTYEMFYRDITTPTTPHVIDEDGNIVCNCTNKINRTSEFRDENMSFHVTINTPITTPGKYYIIFPTKGNFRFYNPVGKYYNAYHFSDFKIGPYIVTGNAEGDLPTTPAKIEWTSGSKFESDHLPDSLSLTITNATSIGVHKNAENSYNTTLSADENQTNISVIATSGENKANIALPAGWYIGEGEYTLTINNPADIFEAMAADGTRIEFSNDEPISTTFTVADPELPEALDFYVRSADATAYEIADDETVNVRLMHGDQALGLRIFVKWTPEASSSHITTKAAEGFSEHDGDMEISSPGQLEYYTTRGSVTSPVKTISFTRADDTNTGIDTPEILNIPLEEGLYNLSGIRVSRTPGPGLYIRRNTDGTTRKVIVR
ncbi:MAG: hypothetical protein K2I64_03860 [Muribaculaceae bacterium]|nr:hypothetical protein [Muribaculaceae bacterium]